MVNIYVSLPRETATALDELAGMEHRDTKWQATLLIEEGLILRGLLPESQDKDRTSAEITATVENMGLPEILTLPEVAALLRISRTTAYTLAANGVIPCLRFGGSVRVLRAEVEKILRQKA